jgi:hypothetical protein
VVAPLTTTDCVRALAEVP